MVEDDPVIGPLILRALMKAGYDARLESDGSTGARTLREGGVAALILDIMLPGVSGWDILQWVHDHLDIPVIVLTASAELDPRLKAFRLGAEDFVAKPFWMEELLVRLQARLPKPNRRLQNGTLLVDAEAQRIFVGDDEVLLTPLQMQLFIHMLERRGRICRREELVERFLGEDASTRTIDAHVARLRAALGDDASIRTERGQGYRVLEDGWVEV